MLFVNDVLDEVTQNLCLDELRVYATGFSGGGRIASQLGCDLSHRFAAIAPVGGVRFPAPCGSAVPVITFHGTADGVNPYEGGGPAYWGYGVEEAVEGWAAHNSCDEVESEQYSASVTEIEYEGDWCEDVVLYRIEGFGHQWPDSPIDVGLGPTTDEIDATEVMWDFFQKHHL